METIFVKEVCITNDCGGTEILPKGKYEVQVQKSWHDYETGGRGIGKLLDKRDIEKACRIGTTKFTPDDYKKYGEKAVAEIKKSKKSFDPSKVYFSSFDIIKTVTKRDNY